MIPLTPQDLKFIDNYLKMSEVIYDDVRMELTDHIASAVEEKMQVENSDFYDTFKKYMLTNKRELLKKFSGGGYKSFEPIKTFVAFIFKPIMIVFAVFFFLAIVFFQSRIDVEYFIYEFHNYWLLTMLCFVIIHVIYFYFIKKKRFFAIEQSFLVLTIIYYCFVFFTNPIDFGSYLPIFWIDILVLFFSITYLFFYCNHIRNYYNNKYIWSQK